MKTKGKTINGLNVRQLIFCAEYQKDLKPQEAAVRAGYSEKTAHVQACRMLKNVKIQQHIKAIQEMKKNVAIVDAAYVLNNLKKVLNQCMEPIPSMVWDYEERALSQETDEEGKLIWKFDSSGANKALELLGKYLKLYTDKMSIEDPRAYLQEKFKDVSDEEIDRRVRLGAKYFLKAEGKDDN